MDPDAAFVHALTFGCPQCEHEIFAYMKTGMRNFEQVDASQFHLKCACGWSSRVIGAQALRHSVHFSQHFEESHRRNQGPLENHLANKKSE